MQDVILEPYGGEVLGLGVGATTQLTALMAGGAVAAFALAARMRGIAAHIVMPENAPQVKKDAVAE